MLLRIEFREVGGWPMMYCSPPVPQSGDGLRIQNFGLKVGNDFKRVCDRQRELTKEAKAGKTPKIPTRLYDMILEAMLGKSLDEIVKEAVEKKLEEFKKEINYNGDNPNGPS
jgi:hypothetical protein